MPGNSSTQDTPAPVTVQPPPPPTPLDPPVVYYNKKIHVPPIIVSTKEAADALDKSEWTTNPPPKAGPEPHYPKLFYNINVPVKLVGSAEEEAGLSGDWRE